MAIGARTYPELIVVGEVRGSRAKTWEGERTGTRVEIGTNGGPLEVTYRTDADGLVPSLGEMVAIVVGAFDGQRGSSLTYERNLTHGDLDLIAQQALGAPVKG